MRASTPERLSSNTNAILDAHPSSLEMLRAGDLKIDHDRYQRHQDRHKIRDIGQNYKPEAVGVLLVSRRRDGDYVIDGAHRCLGVVQRFGPEHPVECKVFIGMTIEEEAEVFFTVNSHRTPVKTIDKFRAAWVAREPDVAEIAELLEELGIRYPWHGAGGADRSIVCWGILGEIHRRKGTEHLRQILTLIDRAWHSPNVALQSVFIKGVDYLLRFHSQDEFWSMEEAVARLSLVSASILQQESTTLRGGPLGKSKSAHQAIYEMLHFYYNKGRRNRKLEDLRTREPAVAKKAEPVP